MMDRVEPPGTIAKVRRNFTPTERYAIGKAMEEEIGNRRGERRSNGRFQRYHLPGL